VSLSRPQNGARGRGRRNLVRGVLCSSSVALTPPFPSAMSVHDMPLRSLGRSIGGRVWIPDPRVRCETPARPAAPVARSRRQFSSRSVSSTDPPVVGSRRGRNTENGLSRPEEVRARKRKLRSDRHQRGGQGGPVARLEDRVAKPLQRIFPIRISRLRGSPKYSGGALVAARTRDHGLDRTAFLGFFRT